MYPPGSPDAHRAAHITARLPDLKHVYIQRGAIHYGWCGHGLERHFNALNSLAGIAYRTKEGEGRGMLHVLEERYNDYVVDEGRMHWLDLVNGGDGPWTEVPSGFEAVGKAEYERRAITMFD